MKHIKGDALKVFEESHSAVLIHQVNCQGVMGGGIAKQIRSEYPEHYQDYTMCLDGFGSDKMFGEYFFTVIDSHHSVVGLFSQFDYGTDTRHTNYAAFTKAICEMVEWFNDEVDIIIPKYIGCGLGGGDWNIIEQILLDVEAMCGVEFTCVEYEG